MQIQVANYMLPAMQIVCHLVGPDFNVTSPVPAVDQTTPQPRPTPISLPEGYVAHPDVGFAYKVHDVDVNATDARRRCIEEGAQLALIDSVEKLRYVDRHFDDERWAHVGIIRMYDDTVWAAVSTGLPVSSVPWKSGKPFGSEDCVQIHFGNNGLGNYLCSGLAYYVCEIPILKNITMRAN